MGQIDCKAFAIVSEPDDARRWTATETAKRLGFIVHPTSSLEEALELVLELGCDHPLLRDKHPLLLLAIDQEPSINAAIATLARNLCPGLRIVIATDRPVGCASLVDGWVQADYTGAELREILREACDELSFDLPRSRRFMRMRHQPILSVDATHGK